MGSCLEYNEGPLGPQSVFASSASITGEGNFIEISLTALRIKRLKNHIGAYSFEENDNAFLSNVFFSTKCYFTFFNFLAHNIGNLALFVVPWDEGRFTLGSLMYYVLTLFCIFQFLFGITNV